MRLNELFDITSELLVRFRETKLCFDGYEVINTTSVSLFRYLTNFPKLISHLPINSVNAGSFAIVAIVRKITQSESTRSASQTMVKLTWGISPNLGER